MNRRRGLLTTGLATIAATAATVMLATGAGFAAASAHPAVSGNETFHLVTTEPSAARYVVIASGVFTAGGVDIAGNTTDVVKLAGGGFKIYHGYALKITKEHVNNATCLAVFGATAKFKVFGGTGAYRGISGTGKATISILEIAARTSSGACNPNATPVVNEETIVGKAKVTL